MAKVAVMVMLMLLETLAVQIECYCFLGDLQPCFPAMKATAPSPAPTTPCCDSVTRMSQVCFCQAVSGPDTSMAGLSLSKALSLPLKCGIDVPSGTTCAGLPVPN